MAGSSGSIEIFRETAYYCLLCIEVGGRFIALLESRQLRFFANFREGRIGDNSTETWQE
jgi:hypothetical protein